VVLVLTGCGLKYVAPSLPTPVPLEGDADRVLARVRQVLDT
jgi:hypothetical protein